MTERIELAQNAAGRMVPAMVNGKPQIPYLGVAKYQPRGRKAAPPVRSSKDYPENGDKRVANLETENRRFHSGPRGKVVWILLMSRATRKRPIMVALIPLSLPHRLLQSSLLNQHSQAHEMPLLRV